MPHSMREIWYMKKHMAYVLIIKFYEETVYDCKKLMKCSLKVQMDIKKDIFKVLSKMMIELMKKDMVKWTLRSLRGGFRYHICIPCEKLG